MVENRKDQIFQKQEEAEAIKNRKNRKMNHDRDRQELDQVHIYVHGGMLQRGTQVEENSVEMKVDTGKDGT
eukprot:4527357-Heterocapsa_arctica.AAC.1